MPLLRLYYPRLYSCIVLLFYNNAHGPEKKAANVTGRALNLYSGSTGEGRGKGFHIHYRAGDENDAHLVFNCNVSLCMWSISSWIFSISNGCKINKNVRI